MDTQFKAPESFWHDVNETYSEHLPRLRDTVAKSIETLGLYLYEAPSHRDEDSLKDLLIRLSADLFLVGELDSFIDSTIKGFAPAAQERLQENRFGRSATNTNDSDKGVVARDSLSGVSEPRTPMKGVRETQIPSPSRQIDGSDDVGNADTTPRDAFRKHLSPVDENGNVRFEGTPDQLIDVTNAINKIAYEARIDEERAKSRDFTDREELKLSLIGSDEIVVSLSFLEEAYEALEEVVGLLPDIGTDTDLDEFVVRAYSRVRCCVKYGERKPEPEDIDLSDNDSEEAAQPAKKSQERVEHAPAQEGGAV